MFSNNKDIANIAVALLVVAACYYLYKEVKVQRDDIDKCKSFSIELANRIQFQSAAAVAQTAAVERAEQLKKGMMQEVEEE